MQERLLELGFYEGKVTTGFYDRTKTAVTKFQRYNGLKEDGVVGEQTWNALFSPAAVPASATPMPTPVSEAELARKWVIAKGISDGTDPDAAINRAQMVTMLWRAMGQPAAASGASFADVPADSYYAQAVAWAIENGITAGVGNGKFDPDAACTRGQIATFLYRYMK